MHLDFSDYVARVTSTNENGTHYVKVYFPYVDLHVHSIRVITLHADIGKFVVYQPKIYTYNEEWKTPFELSRKSPLWKVIEAAAIEAVEEGL